MAGVIRSLISTAAGMPIGEAIKRYGTGVLSSTLRAIKAGKEYKKPTSRLRRKLGKEEEEQAEAYLKKLRESKGRSSKASPFSLPAYLRE